MPQTPVVRGGGIAGTARKVVNVVSFNVGWFACVLGAAAEQSWIGPLAVAGVLALHLALGRPKRAELALIAASIAIGLACDSVLISLGAYEPKRWLLPAPLTTIWLVAMWANFAPLLNVSLRWLRGRVLLAAVLGAVGGPMAYVSGQQLGALRLHESLPRALAMVAAAWAGAVPLLVWVSQALERRFAAAASPAATPAPSAR